MVLQPEMYLLNQPLMVDTYSDRGSVPLCPQGLPPIGHGSHL